MSLQYHDRYTCSPAQHCIIAYRTTFTQTLAGGNCVQHFAKAVALQCVLVSHKTFEQPLTATAFHVCKSALLHLSLWHGAIHSKGIETFAECLCTGARPLHSHISLHPDSRLADAFAIYGVPRGITQYMSKKWGQSTPRGTRTGPRVQHPGSSSSGMTAEQLREKLEAVSKASHVVLLEAMQLRFVRNHKP